MSLSIELTPDGASFRGEGPWGESLAAAFPLPVKPDFRVPPALRVLDRLLMDDLCEMEGDDLRLSFETIYQLEPFERADLSLPAAILRDIRVAVRADGYVRTGGDFSVAARLSGADGTIIPDSARTGAWLQGEGRTQLVPLPVYRLLNRIDKGGGPSLEEQHRLIAEVKRLAEGAEAALDSFLEGQEYLTPEAIGIEVEAHGPDRLVVRPTVEGVEEQFESFQASEGPMRTTYTERDGTRRRRLLLSSEERRTAESLARVRELTGADVPRFLENPEAFLPDEIDLTRFSPRVKGLIPRRYRSQPYLDVREGKQSRDWFSVSPRIEMLEDDGTGTAWDARVSPHEEQEDIERAPSGGDRDGNVGPPIPPEAYAELCKQVVQTGERHVLHEGAWITIEPERAQRFLAALEEVEIGEDGEWRVSRARANYVLDVISNVDQLEFGLGVARPTLVDPPPYPVPDTLECTLYPHQEFGFRWLRYLFENNYGGLLADDMGLGKTVQVAALLAYLAEEGLLGPSLLVVPNALIPNWKQELNRFCPNIGRVHEHHGPGRSRSPAALSAWDVVITTYGTLRRDQLVLGEVDWQVIACDEAQNVKNPTTQVTAAVKGMKAKARLALTGTPVENGLSELWCIVDFVEPGKLGSWAEFRDNFERPLIEASEAGQFQAARQLQEELDPHYVRRKKTDVLTGLPKKSERRYSVDLGEDQAKEYARIIRALKDNEMISLQALTSLIQLASHPSLLGYPATESRKYLAVCPKLAKTVEVLEDIQAQGEKVVIFTRFRRMQDILQQVLSDRFGVVAPIINGEHAGWARQRRVESFNKAPGFGALILSPEAAGVGLNITGANHVIHYTRLWNPAKENQATDRVHRIGQTKPVTVHYPIVKGDSFRSIEEHLDDLLAEKSRLAENVLWPRESLSVHADLQRVMAEA